MRVIAGSRRSIPLQSVPGNNTRPTTDRIKETLFNILAPDLTDCLFLDLYAGSGQIGIEALSRGARHAYFIEQDRSALDVLKQNLHKTKFEDSATVLSRDVQSGLMTIPAGTSFDLIFMDPPYRLHEEAAILQRIYDLRILKPDGQIIIETDRKRDLSDQMPDGFLILREKKYKTNQHVFAGYRK